MEWLKSNKFKLLSFLLLALILSNAFGATAWIVESVTHQSVNIPTELQAAEPECYVDDDCLDCQECKGPKGSGECVNDCSNPSKVCVKQDGGECVSCEPDKKPTSEPSDCYRCKGGKWVVDYSLSACSLCKGPSDCDPKKKQCGKFNGCIKGKCQYDENDSACNPYRLCSEKAGFECVDACKIAKKAASIECGTFKVGSKTIDCGGCESGCDKCKFNHCKSKCESYEKCKGSGSLAKCVCPTCDCDISSWDLNIKSSGATISSGGIVSITCTANKKIKCPPRANPSGSTCRDSTSCSYTKGGLSQRAVAAIIDIKTKSPPSTSKFKAKLESKSNLIAKELCGGSTKGWQVACPLAENQLKKKCGIVKS